MRISLEKLDLHMVHELQLQLLFQTSDEIEAWPFDLAERLNVPVTEAKEMLDELRIFFALAQIAMRNQLMFPWRVPLQPPPKLERLWAEMAADPANYDRFMAVTRFPDGFRYQASSYPSDRQIEARKARILISTASLIGLPINTKYWEGCP